jgi:hypothetical protein
MSLRPQAPPPVPKATAATVMVTRPSMSASSQSRSLHAEAPTNKTVALPPVNSPVALVVVALQAEQEHPRAQCHREHPEKRVGSLWGGGVAYRGTTITGPSPDSLSQGWSPRHQQVDSRAPKRPFANPTIGALRAAWFPPLREGTDTAQASGLPMSSALRDSRARRCPSPRGGEQDG